MKNKKTQKNKLKSFEITLVNDDKMFVGKKTAEIQFKCDPDICTLIDYSSCGARYECGIDLN